MAKKISIVPPRQVGRSITNEKIKAKLEEKHQKQMELIRQYRAEHEKNTSIEEELRQLQMLQYEPVDYLPLMEEEKWVAPPLSSFEHIKTDAVASVEALYQNRFVNHAIMFAASFLLFAILPRPMALTLFLVIGGYLVYTVSNVLKEKQAELILKLEEAQAEIARLEEEEQQAIEEARKQHEFNERLRIEDIKKVLTGNPQAIGRILSASFAKVGFPVAFEATFQIAEKAVRATVVLPDLSVIPKQRSRILTTGYIEYDAKVDWEIYRQYMEMLLGLLAHTSIMVLETAPSVDTVYISGVDEAGKTLIHARVTRELLEKAGRRPVISSLLKNAGVVYSTDPMHRLHPIDEQPWPEDWAEDQELETVTVRSHKSEE
jgi:ABC-type multidrug transport system fused ATPase/permease subunit